MFLWSRRGIFSEIRKSELGFLLLMDLMRFDATQWDDGGCWDMGSDAAKMRSLLAFSGVHCMFGILFSALLQFETFSFRV